jgi:Hsp20/alpha crystallin family
MRPKNPLLGLKLQLLTIFQGLDSPLLKDRIRGGSSGEKELKLRFDVSQYCPEEILVKTVDNKLLVHAKHEENVNGRSGPSLRL